MNSIVKNIWDLFCLNLSIFSLHFLLVFITHNNGYHKKLLHNYFMYLTILAPVITFSPLSIPVHFPSLTSTFVSQRCHLCVILCI